MVVCGDSKIFGPDPLLGGAKKCYCGGTAPVVHTLQQNAKEEIKAAEKKGDQQLAHVQEENKRLTARLADAKKEKIEYEKLKADNEKLKADNEKWKADNEKLKA